MSEDDLALFHDSLDRCHQANGFIDHFYELLIGSSKEIAAKFAGTDFRRQKRVLTASLYMLMVAAEGHAEGNAHLRRLAVLHDRQHLDVRPELYDQWLASLLQAVRDCDPAWTGDVERVWTGMLGPGIDVLRGGY